MDLGSYIFSNFARSNYFKSIDLKFNHCVKEKMIHLSQKGLAGSCAARIISPFVGIGATLTSIALRICSIVEPIIGIPADLAAAICCSSGRPVVPVANAIDRIGHIPRNLIHNGIGIVRDVFKIGIVAGIGGIFTPRAYNSLSIYEVS